MSGGGGGEEGCSVDIRRAQSQIQVEGLGVAAGRLVQVINAAMWRGGAAEDRECNMEK